MYILGDSRWRRSRSTFYKSLFLYIIMCFVFVIAGYAQLVIVDVVLSQIYYCSYLMMFE